MEELIHKYINNELSQQEWIILQAWLKKSPNNITLFNKLLSYNTSAHEGAAETEDIVWRELNIRWHKDEQRLRRKQSFASYYWKVAAILFFISTFSFILYETLKETPVEAPLSNLEIKAAPVGQKINTQLPDGTLVWLNSDSRIKFLPQFSDSCRDVFLEGEAFFEVTENPYKPFRVHNSNLVVTAIGTSFNVSAFEGDEVERVTLITGKVGVSGSNNFYEELLPGNSIEMNQHTLEVRKDLVEPDDMIEWKEGVLLFKNESYSTVMRKLERWYGVSIDINGEIPWQEQFYGRFKNATLENVLRSISSGQKFEYHIDGKQVKIIFP